MKIKKKPVKIKQVLIAGGVSLYMFPMALIAEEESSWYKSLGEKIGQKARDIRQQVDPDGNMQEKATATYESSKQQLEEYYDAAEGYLSERKPDWKKKGGAVLDQAKDKAEELKEGIIKGYEEAVEPSVESSKNTGNLI